jgi:hypothetical protein
MTAVEPPATRTTLPFSPLPEAAAECPLPDGWSIVDYPGRRGKSEFAVFANGRRIASGMTTAQSAARWAHLLASPRA